jgi:hypothetical protein
VVECGRIWTCRPCGTTHVCRLPRWHDGPCRNKRVRELDVCQWDGKVALRFPDPAKEEGEGIFGVAHGNRRG